MRFDVISSGSKGNSTLVISDGKALIIDCGISKRRILKALNSYNLSLEDVQAILISHSHSDHASNCSSFPFELLYASSPILPDVENTLPKEHILLPFHEYIIGNFTIETIPLSHDCKNTLGFIIKMKDEEIAYVTDTGYIPEKDYKYLQNKTYYVFESNHDLTMLFNSSRPEHLVRRIISDKGHLSNVDSAYYLSIFIGDKTKEIVLAHLSRECNTKDKAVETFNDIMLKQLGFIPKVLLKVASDIEETKGGV